MTGRATERRRRAREIWLAIHLYAGLVLGGMFVLLGLTGSLLVFYVEIDRVLEPAVATSGGNGQPRALEEVFRALQAALLYVRWNDARLAAEGAAEEVSEADTAVADATGAAARARRKGPNPATSCGERPRRATLPRMAASKKPDGSAKKLNPALSKPVQPDAALAAVVGDKPMPRSEITSKLWEYIKKNGLQDAKNKRNINADDKLKVVFGGKAQVTMFEMTKLVMGHVKAI
jgi:hypothetical protein